METASIALALNDAFLPLDEAGFVFSNSLCDSIGFILTPLCKGLSLIGEKGILFFLLALILALFAKTRKTAVCVFGSVSCGTLLTSFILKNIIARPRPFETLLYLVPLRESLAAPFEDGFSFPSGHVTAAMAGVTALLLITKKKSILWGYLYVVAMAFSRFYLMAHYPTDVLAALIVGALAAVIAYGITLLIYKILNLYRENAFCSFVLHFDIRTFFSKKKQE